MFNTEDPKLKQIMFWKKQLLQSNWISRIQADKKVRLDANREQILIS